MYIISQWIRRHRKSRQWQAKLVASLNKSKLQAFSFSLNHCLKGKFSRDRVLRHLLTSILLRFNQTLTLFLIQQKFSYILAPDFSYEFYQCYPNKFCTFA